jgi:biofilm PGA synthesis lipoprotein PgaB
MNKYFALKWASIGLAALLLVVSLVSDGMSNARGYHYSNRVAVLEYHHIDPTASEYTVTPEMFRQHLQALKANHYHVISMEQFIQFLKGRGKVPPDAVALTFDDGYESFYRYAYPILKKENMVATNFIIVSYLGTNPGIPFLSWNEIVTMKKDGFSFYSHTYRQHDFAADRNGKRLYPLTGPLYLADKQRMETGHEYEQRVKTDLAKADAIIQSKLGPQEKLFCFPHGRFSKPLLRLGNEEGISYFFSGIDGLNAPGTRLIKRVQAGSAKVSAKKLMNKLRDETTVPGKLKIIVKNTFFS